MLTSEQKMELKSNVEVVCAGHIKPNPEYATKDLEWFVGKMVKRQFHDGVFTEHRWVEIFKATEDRLLGFIGNVPVAIASLRKGDVVGVHPTEISEVA